MGWGARQGAPEGPTMDEKQQLFICVGTACHQLGVRDVLARLEHLLCEEGLEDHVELRGMFCGEECEKAIYMQLGETSFGHVRPHNIEQVFHEQIRPCLRKPTCVTG